MAHLRHISLALISIAVAVGAGGQSPGPGDSYAPSSVLASGKWFKVAVTAEGIYRMEYSAFKDMGLTNPSFPKIYANNQGQLSFYNDGSAPDDLTEVAVYKSTGSDGVFNEGDYILFYALPPGRWKFNSIRKDYDYLKHHYSDTSFYFITSATEGGKRIEAAPVAAGTPDYNSSDTDVLYIYEKDTENLIKSGRDWFQEVISQKINPEFTGLLTGEKIRYRMRVAARASVSTVFRLTEGQTTLKSLHVQPVNIFSTTGTYAQIVDSSGFFTSGSQNPQFEVKFHNNGESSAEGWLDYLILQARKPGSFSGQQLIFRDSRSVSEGRVSEFTVASTISDAVVWDITDIYKPSEVQLERKSDSFSFTSPTDSLRTFIVFRPQAALQLQSKPRPVKNQDLHSSPAAEMVIITHPLFTRHAEMLAGMHVAESGLTSLVVTPEQVYNEFSGGTADIAALRNFVRMKFMRQAGSSKPLRYLLLFGDGSYENRKQPPANPNFIPTYQSQNSNIVVSSFTSDDFFGLLEDGEGEADGTEDIGIGRFPVTDTMQAGIIISKIRKYMSPEGMGDWKNIICLTADDEDGNIHLSDAEGLAALLADSVPEFGISKIYLDAFRQETSANGQSYPDVNKAINDRINAGCLIFNYIGHGNESGLAHERVVRTEDINSWKNGSMLPLFITATCEFSRYDDVEYNLVAQEFIPRTSAGETVLLSQDGGAIALMSTTRVVYSAPNYTLNRNILDVAFDRDTEGKALRLGDIIRIAKNKSGNGSNKRNFSLLGDPALRLSYPWHGRVVTDSINKVHVADGIDSLKALSLVTVSGHIEDLRGDIMNDFTGTVWPLVFDKDAKVKTLANDGGQKVEFSLRNNILFSGKTIARNGRFSFTFLMPRDIDYSFGKGSISYYAGDRARDMNGNFGDIMVGGFSASVAADTTGPEIKLFMNDTLFRNGGITDANPRLLAILEDKGGINTTGAGIGHDISGYLDGDVSNSIVLNSYYENDLNSYSRGKVEYDITGLKPGKHTITLKAWDNFNNSSAGTLLFVVSDEDGFILSDLINYPNPFTDETRISAGHNRPEEELEITMAVFSYGGQKITEIVTTADAGSYSIPPVIWDGSTSSGSRAARGLYIYSLTVKTKSGETATAAGRLVIL